MGNKTFISCFTEFDTGGLGRYIAQLVREADAEGRLGHYFAKTTRPGDEKGSVVIPKKLGFYFRIPGIRGSLGLKDYFGGHFFDQAVSQLVKQKGAVDWFHGFNGKVHESFLAARACGANKLILESANSHLNNVAAQHQLAYKACPIEDTWLHEWQRRKALKEYELADEIFVASEYSKQSFIDAGVAESKIKFRKFQLSKRYENLWIQEKSNAEFRIIFIGRVDITKGVHILREALQMLDIKNIKLIVLGGTTTRGMNRYIKEWVQEDSRVSCYYGDPGKELPLADVMVHPTYEDGFALAPLEAICCGVPVVVTDHTGMKDYVEEGKNGYVIPAGDAKSLAERIRQIHLKPLRGRFAKPEGIIDKR